MHVSKYGLWLLVGCWGTGQGLGAPCLPSCWEFQLQSFHIYHFSVLSLTKAALKWRKTKNTDEIGNRWSGEHAGEQLMYTWISFCLLLLQLSLLIVVSGNMGSDGIMKTKPSALLCQLLPLFPLKWLLYKTYQRISEKISKSVMHYREKNPIFLWEKDYFTLGDKLGKKCAKILYSMYLRIWLWYKTSQTISIHVSSDFALILF